MERRERDEAIQILYRIGYSEATDVDIIKGMRGRVKKFLERIENGE